MSCDRLSWLFVGVCSYRMVGLYAKLILKLRTVYCDSPFQTYQCYSVIANIMYTLLMPVSLEIIGRCRTSVSSASRNEENYRGSLSCSKDIDWNPPSSIVIAHSLDVFGFVARGYFLCHVSFWLAVEWNLVYFFAVCLLASVLVLTRPTENIYGHVSSYWSPFNSWTTSVHHRHYHRYLFLILSSLHHCFTPG